MFDLITKYLSLLSISAVKFLFGPILGFSTGLSIIETIIITVLGMMLTVVVLTYAGTPARKKLMMWLNRGKKRKLFTKKNRMIVRLWQEYGMKGVAFFTPIFFGPPIGMLIALSFGEKKERIISYMFISAVFWGIIMNVAIYYFGEYMGWVQDSGVTVK
ncbi:small multi-drug export protein [Flammeovirga kamogawensis]|uniref:Small multi-drug export protein n=1 Tax=Flammeovirga kamogawensis TaxID=373891 RepID=A0ABX8GV13_9BACT|nr:small multi-drug export protein [Flammeovirga kamogawensis]QWG07163.1 hypothetical protein KM029_17955 [Flammeovirga kamogawensis]TRX68985.1 hypothetical protein EO216_12945 [Flammeovirga kamogawensis]